ncbi:aspartyl protease family protein [uncultured Kordia sp.]|uniref:aspartyl protease family protein n=1 Tax=uncultured Kordia sp. TaxID=507699 RepID=UPI00261C540C|nr:aspartyl protease family protein [uncultured Kordia sp.]
MKLNFKKQYVFVLFYLLISVSIMQAQVATVPFENDNLMFIKVKVNAHTEPLNFVFDTGASTIVLDETVAKELGVNSDYQQPAEGAAGSEVYNVALSQKLHIQDVTLENVHMVLVDLERLSKRGNQKIDGIVGADIMQQFITRLNFDESVIELYKSIDDIENVATYKVLPASLDFANIPQVELEFTLANNQKFSGNFLFDSGANMTFLLNTPFVNKQKIESIIGKTIENKAESLTASSTFKIGKVSNVKLADFEFGEMPIDLSKSEAGVMASNAYTGILGVKIINRFNTILDYKAKKIYFKPNKTYANEFEFPLSGISIEKEAEKIQISNVIEDSEAFTKGVRKGDELVSIDGEKISDIKLYRELLKQKNKKVALVLKDKNGSAKTIIITLRRLI